MNKLNFIELIENEYIANPLSQSTAFWKMREWLHKSDSVLQVNEGVYQVILKNSLLLSFPLHEFPGDLCELNLNTVVFSQQQDVVMEGFKSESYFKLKHNLRRIEANSKNHDYKVVPVSELETKDVSGFLQLCYPNLNIDEIEVQNWMKRKVYDPALWIWVIEKSSNQRVGLGIAEFDAQIKEGSLEWIQVSSSHRRKGIGKLIVMGLIQKLSKKADFVTVAGQIDNESNPEALYRSCGFEGDSKWKVYRRV